MKTHPMTALLWKDYRIIRLILRSGMVGMFLMFLGSLLIEWVQFRHGMSGERAYNWIGALGGGLTLSLMLWMIFLGLVGGTLLASERSDRSAIFVAYLPASRGTKFLSKAIWGVGILMLVLGITFAVLYAAMSDHERSQPEFLYVLLCRFACLAVTGALIFGGAWLFAALTGSPAVSACAGIAMPLLLWAGVFSYGTFQPGWSSSRDVTTWTIYAIVAGLLGILCFISGSIWALVRDPDV